MKVFDVAIAVHGGAGSSREGLDGCRRAALAGMNKLECDGNAIDAAILAVQLLEDDGRFNAGFGSALCLDGTTVEMDAAVMDSEGVLGAVSCLRHIRNPILAAHAVAGTPHCMLAGEGATSAVEGAIGDFPREIDIGIIAVSRREIVMRSNRSMPCVALKK